MKVTKISENKIIAILSKYDAELYNIRGPKSFNINNTPHKQLIVDALEEVNCIELMTGDYILCVELALSGLGSTKITIVAMNENEYNEFAKNNNTIEQHGSIFVDENNAVLDNDALQQYGYNNLEQDNDSEEEYDYDEDEDKDKDDNTYEDNNTYELAEVKEDNNLLFQSQIFCFNKLDDVINVSHLIKNNNLEDSSLYKNTNTNQFYLIIKNDLRTPELNIVLSKLQEFTSTDVTVKESFIKEHYKCILKTNAIENLINF